jgi:hypothetical protein
VLKKSLLAVILLAGILFLLVYPKVYVIRGSAGGVLYWNADEALLFIGGGSDGARMSYPRYFLEPLLASLRFVRPPNDSRCAQAVVIRITDKDIQRFDTDVGCVAAYDVFEGHVYAVYLPKLWEWVGTRFDPATVGERDFQAGRATSMPASRSHPWEFDNIDGWSMRQLGSVGPKYQFNGRPVTRTQLTLNGHLVSFVFSGETFPQMPISVDLLRSDQNPERIWTFDGRPHRVSKAEYEREFPPLR